MVKFALFITVAAVLGTSVATAANTAADPRICRNPNTQALYTPRQCAAMTATLYFRRYMQQLHKSRYLWQGQLLCNTAGNILRYRCDFGNGAEQGTALVSLGVKPTWRRSVTFVRFVCTVEQPGCP